MSTNFVVELVCHHASERMCGTFHTCTKTQVAHMAGCELTSPPLHVMLYALKALQFLPGSPDLDVD